VKDRLIAWGPAAAWAGVLFFLSAVPGHPRPPVFFGGEDKVAHAGLYAVLGTLLASGARRSRADEPRPFVLWTVGLLFGAGDEWHQAFVPGRDVSLGDLAADAVGVALGYWLFIRFLGRRAARAAAPFST
jgi:VanZ family protein